MNWKFLLSLVLLICLFGVFISAFMPPPVEERHGEQQQAPMQIPLPAPTDPTEQILHRKEVYAPWIAGAEEVCERTQDAEAMEVLSYLKQKGRITALMSEFMYTFADAPVENMVMIAPMLPQDALLGPTWAQRDHMGVSVMFSPDDGMIVLKEKQISRLWKGVLLIHEGHHALTYSREHYDHTDAFVFCAKERDTHMVENRLLAILCGRTYTLALQQTRSLFRLRFEGNELLFDPPATPLTVMDATFGKPESEDEEASRNGGFLIAAAFEMIDERYREEEAAYLKADFLRRIYGK